MSLRLRNFRNFAIWLFHISFHKYDSSCKERNISFSADPRPLGETMAEREGSIYRVISQPPSVPEPPASLWKRASFVRSSRTGNIGDIIPTGGFLVNRQRSCEIQIGICGESLQTIRVRQKIKAQNVAKSIDKPPVLKYIYTVLIYILGHNTLK